MKKNSRLRKKWKRLSKKKKIITTTVAVVVVIALVSGTIYITKSNDEDTQTVSIQETKVTTGSISNSIVGTGNLEIDASEEIRIPSGITVKSVKVESGDAVSKGDVLAKVDKISVLEEMESVKEFIEDYDEQIEEEDTSSNQYKILVAKRKDLKKTYKKLKALYKSGTIKATIDGVVGDINVSNNSSTSSQSVEGNETNVSATDAKASTLSIDSTSNIKATTLITNNVKATTLSVNSTDNGNLEMPGSTPYGNVETTTEAISETEKNQTPPAGQPGETNQNNIEETTASSQNNTNFNGNSNLNQTSGTNGQNNNVDVQSNSNYISGSSGSETGNMSAASEANSDDSSNAAESSEGYDSDDVIAFTLALNESMMISVNVDELDINSVEKGQEASITLDAIEDETFTGTVKRVSNSASSSGNGVAKYTVEITMAKDERMKVGMNASATIIVESKENILMIPINALQEKGNQVFVYMSKDSDGNLSGETTVTTGLSDGDTVEITEGLSEGDTVYYQKIGNISGNSSNNNGGFPGGNENGDFPGGDMQGGSDSNGGPGNMPNGGPGQGGQS